MSDPQQRFDEALGIALVQRGRLRQRLGLTRARLTPLRIAEDAKEVVEDSAKSTLDDIKASDLLFLKERLRAATTAPRRSGR